MNNGVDPRPPFAALDGKRPDELFSSLPTPCFVVDEAALVSNARLLHDVAEKTGCRVLLAQKAFSNYDFYPALAPYLAGTEASGLYEARLGREAMPEGEVHVFCAAYRDEDIDELTRYADHVVFNSVAQLSRFGKRMKDKGVSVGLRINPCLSTQEGHAIYDPCAPGSRLGVTREEWERGMTPELIDLLDGLHFHTLCEQNADALEATLEAVEAQFADVLPRMKWLNMGGGHHVTRKDYDVDLLCRLLVQTRDKWGVQVYLEPGEAVALNAGWLVCRVLDVVRNGDIRTAVLDASAACHMPDVIEMPYVPPLYGADALDDPTIEDLADPAVFRLAGPTCLAGDVVGAYRFASPVETGDLLVFGDMAIYTTCKTNTFNGMPLPDIFRRAADGTFHRLTSFCYDDFKYRLGKKG